ncbi:uncharacterized protein LOC144179163 [Haemaphysalis longicornis]
MWNRRQSAGICCVDMKPCGNGGWWISIDGSAARKVSLESAARDNAVCCVVANPPRRHLSTARVGTRDLRQRHQIHVGDDVEGETAPVVLADPFREAEKARGESYSEFAYKLRENMEEWLKEAKAFGEHDKVVECFGFEQFYRRLPENLRLWVQDRPGVNTVDKAAQLADEFIARRGAQGPKDGQKEFRPRPDKLGPKGRAPYEKSGAKVTESANNETGSENEKSANAEAQRRKKAFEARKQSACYNCGETGHFAVSCKKGKLVFHIVHQDEESRQLLEPYVRELAVNGKPCRVLRDSAATMDVVHPSYVEPHQFTGDCAWIKQAVEAQSVCLPIARITIDGPFGKLETEAAVSPSLPAQYPYLFSNRSDQLLRERGLVFGEGIVFALTRSKARELGAKAAVESRNDSRREEVGKLAATSADVASERGQSASLQVQIAGVEQQQQPAETDDSLAELFVAPTSESLERLLHVGSTALSAEQRKDHTLEKLLDNVTEGVAKKNVRFQAREEILYRKYRDRRGVEYDQLVVPQVYRQDLLRLAHGNSWLGHLGIRKTKDRLLQEYYWPGCFRDVENFVRTCDVCQRVGKPGDKTKAPMKLVPVIAEPFRRLVIDTVGPLPVTTSGYRHILTVLCPATKFPEAVPLKELSSVEIVNALLSVFARVGFLAEIQSDQGRVWPAGSSSPFRGGVWRLRGLPAHAGGAGALQHPHPCMPTAPGISRCNSGARSRGWLEGPMSMVPTTCSYRTSMRPMRGESHWAICRERVKAPPRLEDGPQDGERLLAILRHSGGSCPVSQMRL